jgi:hypothetical protein
MGDYRRKLVGASVRRAAPASPGPRRDEAFLECMLASLQNTDGLFEYDKTDPKRTP